MKTQINISIASVIIVLLGLVTAMESCSDHEDTSDRVPVHIVGAPELLAAFAEDEIGATATYVGTTEQVVQVEGSIRAIEPIAGGKVNIILETGDPLAGVVCEFEEVDVPDIWRSGSKVSVKGVCSGMLMDVVLVRCAAVHE